MATANRCGTLTDRFPRRLVVSSVERLRGLQCLNSIFSPRPSLPSRANFLFGSLFEFRWQKKVFSDFVSIFCLGPRVEFNPLSSVAVN